MPTFHDDGATTKHCEVLRHAGALGGIFRGVAYRLFIDSLEANEVNDGIEHWCCCLAGSSSTERTSTTALIVQPTLEAIFPNLCAPL